MTLEVYAVLVTLAFIAQTFYGLIRSRPGSPPQQTPKRQAKLAKVAELVRLLTWWEAALVIANVRGRQLWRAVMGRSHE